MNLDGAIKFTCLETCDSKDSLYELMFDINTEDYIGSGGFGSVYRVKHRTDDQIYAVKKIKANGICLLIKMILYIIINNLFN